MDLFKVEYTCNAFDIFFSIYNGYMLAEHWVSPRMLHWSHFGLTQFRFNDAGNNRNDYPALFFGDWSIYMHAL